MNFQPSFRVHVAEKLCFVDMPLIITTAYTNPAGYPAGEWFLIIPDNAKHVIAQRTRLNFREFPPEPVPFNEEFLLNEVLNQAMARLRQYIIEQKSTEVHSLLKGFDILPSSQNIFVNLWMRGGYSECLECVHEKTGCRSLADFLGLVFSLPKFTKQEL